MNTDTAQTKRAHHGRNIKRLREMLGVKQDTLAAELNITQAAVSKLEAKEEIEEGTLEKVAKILNLPVDAIKNFSDEATYNYINTFYDNSSQVGPNNNFSCTFNPIDKVIELYERMLSAEKEKVKMLEKLLNKK